MFEGTIIGPQMTHPLVAAEEWGAGTSLPRPAVADYHWKLKNEAKEKSAVDEEIFFLCSKGFDPLRPPSTPAPSTPAPTQARTQATPGPNHTDPLPHGPPCHTGTYKQVAVNSGQEFDKCLKGAMLDTC